MLNGSRQANKIPKAEMPWVFIMGGMGSIPPNNLKENLVQLELQIQALEKLRDAKLIDLNLLEKHISKNKDLELSRELNITKQKNILQQYEEELCQAFQRLNILKSDSIYGMFFPPTKMNCRIKLVKGTGTVQVQAHQFHPYDLITAASEQDRIAKYLHEIKVSSIRPDRIVLNGYSRGASACLELARAIYLEFGDAIKMAINIIDPVPGPGRHAKSKKVIPPSVDSLIVYYLGGDKNPIFVAQDMLHIFFDPHKTTVTTLVFPLKHNLVDVTIKHKDKQKSKLQIERDEFVIWFECMKEISCVTRNFWRALAGKEVEFCNVSQSDYAIQGKGLRKHGLFGLATNPYLNASMHENDSLRKLHVKLLNNISPQYVYPVSDFKDDKRINSENHTANGEEILKLIYIKGKSLAKSYAYQSAIQQAQIEHLSLEKENQKFSLENN